MKKFLVFLLLLAPCVVALGQTYDPVTLMLAFQAKYKSATRFSGDVRFNKLLGDPVAAHFVVEGEKFHISWRDGELFGDGTHEWEVLHRSKRVKRRFYDPLITPAVVMAFRLVHLDLTAEPVRIGGTVDRVAIDVDFGSSVAQGSHTIVIDTKTLEPRHIAYNIGPEGYFEQAEIVSLKAGDAAETATFSLDFDAWKAKGYSLTDMAKGDSDVIWPEERALRYEH